MTATPNELGRQLRALREDKGWSLRTAATKAGIAEGTWRQYEKGSRSVRAGVEVPVNYQSATLRAMAKVLEVDVEPLLTLAAQAPPADISRTSAVIQAILDDPYLIPEAREHLVNQYGLLLRIASTATAAQQAAAVTAQGVADIRNRPSKSTPGKATKAAKDQKRR